MPKIKTNRLCLARTRLGLGQKQVAQLLANKTIYQLSRYENGQRLPSLITALKLSIVYKVPVRILFHAHYKSCFEELRRRAGSNRRGLDLTEPTDSCSYIDIMKSGFIDEAEKEKVRRHIKVLMDERRVNILHH